MNGLQNFIVLAARILFAVLFVKSGYSKLIDPSYYAGYMEHMGVPGILVWPTLFFEIGSGLALVLGWQVRPIAFLMAGFCLVTGAMFHLTGYMNADNAAAASNQMIHLLKNISLSGGYLMLTAFGAGAFSLDHYRKH